MSYLLNTCVLSELAKSRPNPGVAGWIRDVEESRLFVSALTLGEIRKGVDKLPDGKKKAAIQVWFENQVITRLADRVLPVDLGTCLGWGQLSAESETAGRPVPVIDALLASTALAHRLVLVTRNVQDFDDLPVRVINPWT